VSAHWARRGDREYWIRHRLECLGEYRLLMFRGNYLISGTDYPDLDSAQLAAEQADRGEAG
jgi:hypothetical protein